MLNVSLNKLRVTNPRAVWYTPPASVIVAEAFFEPVPANNFSLTAEAGSVVVTGSAAGTERGALLAAEAGASAVTGTSAALELGLRMVAEAGSVGVTGSSATTSRTARVTSEPGSVLIGALETAVLRTGLLPADAGVFALTGDVVGTFYGRQLLAESVAMAVAAEDAALVAAPWDSRPIRTGISAQAWS